MNEYEGEVGVAVVVGRFCIDREYQSSATLRGRLDGGCVVGDDKTDAKSEGQSKFWPTSPSGVATSAARIESIPI